ncbi:MAG: SBBP repeat-containing protein, partial [Nitrospirota bacterium]
MRTRQVGVVGVLLMGLCLAGQVAMAHTGGEALSLPAMKSHPANHPVAAQLLGLPLQFEANRGQVDDQVKFLARGKGYTLFLTPTESVMVLTGREASRVKSEAGSDPTEVIGHESQEYKRSVVRMKLEGANPSPAIDGMEQLPGIVNYFIGNDPAKWRTKIPTYAKVQYKEAYPGIDLAYYGNQGKLEYDFIVAPGADPSQIKLAFEWASDITVADSGDLLLTTALGEVRLQKPIVYQLENDGHKTLVAGNYMISPNASKAVGIQLAAYDYTKPVVIDPILLYSTYLGGSANEDGFEFGPHGIAVDSLGNAYIAGATTSTDFPGVTAGSVQPIHGGGLFDAYVAKLSSTGSSILWASYLGGTGSTTYSAGGTGYDRATAIALDPSGNAYVTGLTHSTTSTSSSFPTTPGAYRTFGPPGEVFITKISSDGASLVYSTLLGGNGDRDIAWSIAVDAAGHAYVAGETRLGGASFPTTPGAFQTIPGGVTVYLESSDAFVTKLNPSGTGLVYSTYIGGSNNDGALGIAVDPAGNAYVTGNTRSTNFPGVSAGSISATLGGVQDAFVVRLNASGTALDYASYLGGGGDEFGRAITVDSTGNAYATGQTTSTNFPITSGSFQTTIGNPTLPGQYDAFVTKISSAGSLIYSTFLGGNSYDGGWAIKVDSSGNAHVVGRGRSSNFPGIVPLTGSSIPTPTTWAFYSKINPTGTGLVFSVHLGGTTARTGTSGDTEPLGLALDAQSHAYITGFTRAANFPLLSAAQSTPGGTIDDFVMKIGDRPIADAGPDQPVSMGTLVTLDGTASTGSSLTYTWTRISGPSVALGGATTAHPTFTAPNVPAAGATVTFELVVCEGTSSNCSDPDTVNVHISNINQPPVAQAGPDQTV